MEAAKRYEVEVPGLMISNELTGHGKIVSHVSEARHGAPSVVVGGADVGHPTRSNRDRHWL